MITDKAQKPDWYAASKELVSQLHQLANLEERVNLLQIMCMRLGYEGYPAFLKILCMIDQYGDEQSRLLLISTLGYGLQTGRLPTGPLPTWGSSTIKLPGALSRTKQHGPIEYLCIWYTQPTALGKLDNNNFKTCLAHLLHLLSDDDTKHLYGKKLLSDARDPLSGSYSSSTRTGLTQLAADWMRGYPIESVSEDCIANLAKSPFESLERQALLRGL